MDSIPLLPDLGPAALAGMAVVAVLFGWLVPRRFLQDARADARYWREVAQTQQQTLETLTAQTGAMVRTLDMHTSLIQGLAKRGDTEP